MTRALIALSLALSGLAFVGVAVWTGNATWLAPALAVACAALWMEMKNDR